MDYRLRDDKDLSSKADLLSVAYENQFPYFMIIFPASIRSMIVYFSTS